MELPKINERHNTKFRIAKKDSCCPGTILPEQQESFVWVCHGDGSADTLYHALFASPANGIKSVSAEPSLCHAHMCHHFNSQSGKAASIRLI